jgi:putative transposase
MKGQLFQLYPTKNQAKTLRDWIGCQRFVYNAKVAEDRYFRTFSRKSLSQTGNYAPVDQTYSQFKAEADFLKKVPSQVLRNGAYRWKDAYKRFFKKLGGRPKVKKNYGRQSVLITLELFNLHQNKDDNWFVTLGTKRFPVGNIKLSANTPINELPKMIVISVIAGKWSLSFNTHEINKQGKLHHFPTPQEALDELSQYSLSELIELTNGADRGVVLPVCDTKSMITEKMLTENDRKVALREKKRKKYQQRLAKQTRHSQRYKRTKQKIARISAYKARCINNMAHKISHALTHDKTTKIIALEALLVKNMTGSAKGNAEKHGKNVKQKAGLNRSILESGWGRIKTFSAYKSFKQGKLFVTVPPHYTSQECAACGMIHKENRVSQHLFSCQACGVKTNADLNASNVIAQHAAFGVYQHFAGQELSTRAGSDLSTQTPVEFKVSPDVISLYRAQSRETGNRHPELAKAS